MESYFQQNTAKLRHRLISEIYVDMEKPYGGGSVKSINDLKLLLQTAIELEHSTIPPYLSALYSIKEGTNLAASTLIRGVVVEEMLHMIMAANILNAIGGHPFIKSKHFIPEYPTYLPDSDKAFIVNLEKFSQSSIETFLLIEKPAHNDAPPESHNYKTIGQFYKAIRIALEYYDRKTPGGIFNGDRKNQIMPAHYYGSGGKLVEVTSLASAKLAIEEIVGQGEGIDDTIFDTDKKIFGQEIEYAHYFRFNEIHCERMYSPEDSAKCPPTGPALEVDWKAVHNMKLNPKLSDYKKGSELYKKTYDFNVTYNTLLANLHKACNGHPETLMEGMALMYAIKYKAVELLNIPTGGKNGEMAGPTFEYVEIK